MKFIWFWIIFICCTITYHYFHNKFELEDLQNVNIALNQRITVNNSEILKLKKQVKILQKKIDEFSKVTVKATAYNAVASQTDSDPNITSCLASPTIGSIAVSQDLYFKGWSCGKRVHIKGKGIFIIKDVMHYRKKEQIDIVMKTEKQALQFGVKNNLNAVLLTHYENT